MFSAFVVWYAWGWCNLIGYNRNWPRCIFLSEALAIFIGLGEVRLVRLLENTYCRYIWYNPVIWDNTIK